MESRLVAGKIFRIRCSASGGVSARREVHGHGAICVGVNSEFIDSFKVAFVASCEIINLGVTLCVFSG